MNIKQRTKEQVASRWLLSYLPKQTRQKIYYFFKLKILAEDWNQLRDAIVDLYHDSIWVIV